MGLFDWLKKKGKISEPIREREIEGKTVEKWRNKYEKGITFERLGRYEDAIRCYDEALSIAPFEELVKIKNKRKIAEDKLREQRRKEEIERKKALNAINEAYSLLQQAKELGINIEQDEKKLNNAKLKLDGKNFSTATKLASECKNSLEQKINEYKRRAKESIDLAYSKIKEAEKLGINVSDAKDLHRKAILEFDNGEYEKAIEYAEKSRKAAEDEIRRYNHAEEQIEASKEIVKSIKKLISIPKAEEMIEKAESALKIGNYNNAVKLAKEAEEEALRAKKDKEETSKFISSIELSLIHI